MIVNFNKNNSSIDYNNGDGEWADLEGSIKYFVNDERFWIHLQTKAIDANIPIVFNGYVFSELHRDMGLKLLEEMKMDIVNVEKYKIGSPVLGDYLIASVKPKCG